MLKDNIVSFPHKTFRDEICDEDAAPTERDAFWTTVGLVATALFCAAFWACVGWYLHWMLA